MKKLLFVLTFGALALTSIVAQTADTTKNKNVNYSFAWGLFQSPNYPKGQSAALEVKTATAATVKPSSTDAETYEHKSILWGAIQWTEKKKITSPSNKPQK